MFWVMIKPNQTHYRASKEGISITFEDVVDEKISSLKKEETLVIYTPAIKVLNFRLF